jgi:putative LysE/RhtB family amino acid efflux pump
MYFPNITFVYAFATTRILYNLFPNGHITLYVKAMDTGSLILLTRAAGLGLLLAVPVGPLALLCLRRSLTLGMRAGLVTGLGVATADAIYAAVAAFALGAAGAFIEDSAWLGPLGGLALIALGVRDVFHRPVEAKPATLRAHVGAWAGAVLLTLANPATVLTFAAVIIGLGLVPDLASPLDGSIFVAGVFLGSGGWWVVLSAAGGSLGNRLPSGFVPWTRRIAGIAFIGFGVFALLR